MGQGPGILPAGGGEGPGAVGLPRGRGVFRAGAQCPPHLPEQRDTREQAIDLRLALRTALLPSGDFGRILACLREAEALAEALDDPRRLGQVSVFLSNHFYFMGAYDQAIAAAQRALALATAGGDVVLHALANQYLGQSLPAQGDYRRAIDCFGQTVASLEGARRHERFGQVFLPAVSPVPGSPGAMPSWARSPRAEPSGKKGSGLPRRLLTPRASWWPRGGSVCWPSAKATCPGRSPCSNGPWASVRTRTSRSISPWMAAALGAAYTLAGRVADAVPLLTQAMEQTTATERVDLQALCRLSLGEAQLLAGRLEEAHALAERALALAREHQERGHQAYALRLLGEIAARREPRSASRPKPTTARPSPWPRNSACARSRPTATAASAPCMPDRPAGAGPHRAVHRHRPVPCHGHDLLAAPDEAAQKKEGKNEGGRTENGGDPNRYKGTSKGA